MKSIFRIVTTVILSPFSNGVCCESCIRSANYEDDALRYYITLMNEKSADDQKQLLRMGRLVLEIRKLVFVPFDRRKARMSLYRFKWKDVSAGPTGRGLGDGSEAADTAR